MAMGTVDEKQPVSERTEKNSKADPHEPVGMQRLAEDMAYHDNSNTQPEKDRVDSHMVMNGYGLFHVAPSLIYSFLPHSGQKLEIAARGLK